MRAYFPVSATQLHRQRLEQGVKGAPKLTFSGGHETSAKANSVRSFKSLKEAWLNYAWDTVPSSIPHKTSALGSSLPSPDL